MKHAKTKRQQFIKFCASNFEVGFSVESQILRASTTSLPAELDDYYCELSPLSAKRLHKIIKTRLATS